MTDPIKLAIEALEYHTEQTRPISKSERALAALRSIKPDCRGCSDFSNDNDPACLYPPNACTDADKYHPLPFIQLYKVTK